MNRGRLVGLISKYGLGRPLKDGDTQCLRWENDKQVPWNKHSWETGRASLELTVCPDSKPEPWVEFDVREIFTGKSGRTMQKVIHVTMSHEDAMAFAYHILSGKFKAD